MRRYQVIYIRLQESPAVLTGSLRERMEYYSRQISKLIQELSTLPGIGNEVCTASGISHSEYAKEQVEELSSAILDAKQNVRYCKECFTLTDEEICPICSDSSRNHKVIMVVEKHEGSPRHTRRHRSMTGYIMCCTAPSRPCSESGRGHQTQRTDAAPAKGCG